MCNINLYAITYGQLYIILLSLPSSTSSTFRLLVSVFNLFKSFILFIFFLCYLFILFIFCYLMSFFTDALFCCCNTVNFPTMGLIKEHLNLNLKTRMHRQCNCRIKPCRQQKERRNLFIIVAQCQTFNHTSVELDFTLPLNTPLCFGLCFFS